MFAKIFYVLGGIVALVGIIFFVAQIWDDLGGAGHVLITLGLGLILAGIGSYFLKGRPESRVGGIYHALAGLLIPGGAMVTLHETIGLDNLDTLWPVAITFGAIFVFYLLLNLYHKNEVLTLFGIANGTAFLYFLVGAIINDTNYIYIEDIYAYLTMVVGLSYLFLAHSFRSGWNKRLVGVFNFFGAVGFLAAAFTRVDNSPLWQFFFFVLTIGGLALAVYLKSRVILIVSMLFLVAHFVYITRKYFADSVGWPILLVIFGFLLIGLGYVSISINKKIGANPINPNPITQ